MKEFMDKDFLLETETARHLFHDYAEHMPLVDYHCHINPKEIYEDRRFDNLAEVWLGGKQPDGGYFGDHYKWRVMRSNGVSEDYITGDRPDYERFLKFVEALEMAIGNPMYHWCNLELRQFFGYDKPLTVENAEEAWKWHGRIASDESIGVKVCPSFRPDKAINIQKEGFAEYIGKLAQSVGKETLDTAQEVMEALVLRLEYFKTMGCRASDHGLDYIPFRPASDKKVNEVFQKAMAGEELSTKEAERYQTAVLLCLGRAYHRLGIAMQIHYSCYRMFRRLGPDTGFDMIAQNTCGADIARFLSTLDATGELPKTILYSLNPADNAQLGTMLGCFQSDEVPGKIQHGSAWWFNDTKSGMEEQMKSLANLGLLGNFVGMLTDSRSFLSYARHDYFRRIFCNLVGNWVENGEYPNDDRALRRIVEGVCFRNAERYFEL